MIDLRLLEGICIAQPLVSVSVGMCKAYQSDFAGPHIRASLAPFPNELYHASAQILKAMVVISSHSYLRALSKEIMENQKKWCWDVESMINENDPCDLDGHCSSVKKLLLISALQYKQTMWLLFYSLCESALRLWNQSVL